MKILHSLGKYGRRPVGVIACCAAGLTVTSAAQPQTPAIDGLLARVSSWLTWLEPALSEIVGDERLTQRQVGMFRRARERVLLSTVSFARLPGDGAWLGLREVLRINGETVPGDATDLLALLRQPADGHGAPATALAVRDARHNLGYPRTTNMPTLPLEILLPRNRARFTFALVRSERVGGALTTRISFEEHARPALIKSPDGTVDLLARGALWIEPDTGRLHQARVEAFDSRYYARPEWTLTVRFSSSPEVGVWVPIELSERFAMPGGGSGEGRARYSRFRRFTTSARVRP